MDLLFHCVGTTTRFIDSIDIIVGVVVHPVIHLAVTIHTADEAAAATVTIHTANGVAVVEGRGGGGKTDGKGYGATGTFPFPLLAVVAL